jgi:hypothetical protein
MKASGSLLKSMCAAFFVSAAIGMTLLATHRDPVSVENQSGAASAVVQALPASTTGAAAAPVVARAAVGTPVVARTLVQKWGLPCKGDDHSCDRLAAQAEAEYQAQGGDAHQDAENHAVGTPEFQAAADYFSKFLTARKSGGSRTELCALLGLAHLGYVQVGATDEVSDVFNWQNEYSCPRS